MSPAAATGSSIRQTASEAAALLPRKPAETAGGEIFSSQLEAAETVKSALTEEKLRHEAQRLVSQVFFGTLLKQMHNSPFKSELWSGGRGGQAFEGMFDQHLADRMAKASFGPKGVKSALDFDASTQKKRKKTLVDSIVRSLRRGRARDASGDGGQTDLRG